MAHDVYISFASPDRAAAEQVCNNLEYYHINCWIAPRNILPGADWQDSVVDGIIKSRAVVLIYSANADRSQFLSREISLAVKNGIAIILFVIDRSRPKDSLDYLLGESLLIDGSRNSATAIHKLASAIRTLVAPQMSAKATSSQNEFATAPRIGNSSPGKGFFRFLRSLLPGSSQQQKISENDFALRLIDDLSVTRIEDIADRRVSHSRINYASLPPRIDKALDTFENISRQAHQLGVVQDSLRRIVIIEDALQELSALKSALVKERNGFASAVVRISSEWTDILVEARRFEQQRVEDQGDVENPFISGTPVKPMHGDLFIGRRDIALDIERNILGAVQVPTLLLYGQRRMGKTSIVYQLPELLGPRFLPVQVDCQAPAMAETAVSLLQYLSRNLSNALNSRLGLPTEDANGRRPTGISPIPKSKLGNSPFSAFDKWMDDFMTRMPGSARLLLCLDEYERLDEAVLTGWGGRFLDTLRHWTQHRQNFHLLFVGSRTFEQVGAAWTDRFLSARRLKLSFLERADVERLLTQPTPTFKLRYDPDALSLIYDATRGQPFLTQALAFELVNHMNRVGRRCATATDIKTTIELAMESAAEYFADLWSSRSEAEQQVLLEVAHSGRLGACSTTVQSLQDYDVLDVEGDFAVPIVKEWVRRRQI